MPTVRELRATAQKELDNARTLNEKYEKEYGKGYLKNEKVDLPEDIRENLNSSVQRYTDAKKAVKARVEADANDFDSLLGETLDIGGDSGARPVPSKTRTSRTKSGRRARRDEDDAPNRRAITWKPKGAHFTRAIGRQEHSQYREDALMAHMMPEHPLAKANLKRHEDKNYVLTDEIDAKGGYFTVHEKLMAGILKQVDDEVFMMKKARQIILNDARVLSTIVRTSKASSFAFTNALTDITTRLENSLKYGKKTWNPHYYMGAFWIHRDLIQAAFLSPIQLMLEELRIDLDEMLENVLLYGTGMSVADNGVSHPCPLGIMVADTRGISTARDTTVGATTTTYTGDVYIKSKYLLKKKYRSRADWLLHRDHIAYAAMMKDSQNNYIWKESLAAGEPSTLSGIPVEESEWMPNTFAASNYIGILGDFSYYWVVQSKLMEMQRCDELAARQNLVEYHFRGKIDGAPALEEAFVRPQFAAG